MNPTPMLAALKLDALSTGRRSAAEKGEQTWLK
jgi:hypothetical protein